jgi:hypothetical protein
MTGRNKGKNFIENDTRRKKFILNGEKILFANLMQKECKGSDKEFHWKTLNNAFVNENFAENIKDVKEKKLIEIEKCRA